MESLEYAVDRLGRMEGSGRRDFLCHPRGGRNASRDNTLFQQAYVCQKRALLDYVYQLESVRSAYDCECVKLITVPMICILQKKVKLLCR
jgi:hypothetical protein